MNKLHEVLFPYFYIEQTGTLSSIWVGSLHLIFLLVIFWLSIKCLIVNISITKVQKEFSEDLILSNKYLSPFWLLYQQHFLSIDDNKNKKTDDFAEQYFGPLFTEKNFNIDFWKSLPGIFVGIGILGTFTGLCFGLSDFNFSSSKVILSSIQVLIDGIQTAFLTSLHGISLSILIGGIGNFFFNLIENKKFELCTFLNSKYKLTKSDKIKIKNSERADLLYQLDFSANERLQKFYEIIKTEFDARIININKHLSEEFDDIKNSSKETLQKLLITKDIDGNELTPSNIFRDILRESEEQTKSLKSFSTDLADVIMDKFETMSSQSILPEFEKITKSLNSLESSIKSFSSSTGQDISKELGKIIESLQNNLQSTMEDFREAFSSGAMQQLNKVIESLDESADVMNLLPSTLETMLSNINQTNNDEAIRQREAVSDEFDNVTKNFRSTFEAIIENLNNIENTRTERESERQKQTSTELESTISNFKLSIDSILDNLSKAEQQQINREQKILNQVNNNLADSVRQMEDMILVQESYTSQLNSLLKSTSEVVQDEKILLDKIYTSNELMVNVSNKFESISFSLEKNTEKVEASSNHLESSLQSIKTQFNQMSDFNETFLEQIGDVLSSNQEILHDYVSKFEIIKTGLNDIFAEVEVGLTRYSSVVKGSINDYLSEFSTQLTSASEKLAGSIETLDEFFELISDKLEEAK